MKSPLPVTAVFDIGKTNKKFFLFDEDYSIVQKNQTRLEEAKDEDGDPCEDIERLQCWVEDEVKKSLQNKKIRIKTLNFSTYGASFVHLDKAGKVVHPLYNYLKPYPEDLLNQFYSTYRGLKELSIETASPPMGMLNSGLQLYWLKYAHPKKFMKIQRSLHFPQYLSYLITGNKASEMTSIGCHTALWNFEQAGYHSWVQRENMEQLFPDIQPVKSRVKTSWNGAEFEAGIGIHDSSAALTPYLFAMDDPFMLVSTGTWSITFNPFNKQPLTFEELQRDCLCYLNVYGKQVKAARFFLGNEYSHQKKKLDKYFNRNKEEDAVELDAELIRHIITKPNPAKKLKLEQAYNSGPFPQDKPGEWRVSDFDSYEEGYHQLMLDLVAIQVESIKLAQGESPADKLIITGGFSQNELYMTLLSSFFPDKKICTSSLPNASALGAAMVVNKSVEDQDEQAALKKLLGLKHHSPRKELGIEHYSWKESVFS